MWLLYSFLIEIACKYIFGNVFDFAFEYHDYVIDIIMVLNASNVLHSLVEQNII